MECTKESRRALKTVRFGSTNESTVAAICTCMKTAVSSSTENCLHILDRKHKGG